MYEEGSGCPAWEEISVMAGCSVPGLDPATSCWRGGFCACDSASSSTVCAAKLADAALFADVHCGHNDVEEVFRLLLGNNSEYCSPYRPPEEALKAGETMPCSCAAEFFSLDDLWDSTAGPAPDWEGDFSALMDEWMLDADMISVDGICDLEIVA